MRVFSARALFNLFHSGYCSAYIQNPAYLLVVDFRSLEDWIVERVITSQHHERLLALDRSMARPGQDGKKLRLGLGRD